jgi:hypothetical protein
MEDLDSRKCMRNECPCVITRGEYWIQAQKWAVPMAEIARDNTERIFSAQVRC